MKTVQQLLNEMDHGALAQFALLLRGFAAVMERQSHINEANENDAEARLRAFEQTEEDIMQARYAGGLD